MKIASIKDPKIIAARALNRAANRTETCLLEGELIVDWALQADLEIEHFFVSDGYTFKDPTLFENIKLRGIEIYRCSDGIMKKINDAKHLTPVIGVTKLNKNAADTKPPIVLVLDDLQDPGNIGTIIRTSAAFGINHVGLTGRSHDLFNKKTITASRGQVFSINATNENDTLTAIQNLKQRGYQVVATSPRGQALQSLSTLDNKPVALIVGNETEGSAQTVLDAADITIQIPMQNDVESLNVGVATGISLYELKFKVIIAMLTEHIRSTLGRELGITHQLLRKVLDKSLSQVCDYSHEQIILLMIMVCNKKMSRTQMEHDTKKQTKALDTMLQPLLDGDLVVEDKDGFRVSSAGEALLGKLWPVIEDAENSVLEGFSDAEKIQFKAMLTRVHENCEKLLFVD